MSVVEKKSSNTPAVPPAGYVHWYVNPSGQPQYVDESGIVRSFDGPTGPTGPIGATGATGPIGITGPTGPSHLYNVIDNGMVPNDAGAAAANVTAWNALMATIPDRSVVYFPPGAGTFHINAALTIPSTKHLVIRSDGQDKVFINTTSATANVFVCDTGEQEFRSLAITSTVTRTAGAAIHTGGNPSVHVRDCHFIGMWDGILYTGGTFAGLNCTLADCTFTDTRNRGVVIDGPYAMPLIHSTAMSGTPGTQVEGIAVTQCMLLLINASGITDCQYNLRITPAAGQTVNSLVMANSSFDKATVAGVHITGAGNTTRIKAVNATFGSCETGIDINGTGTSPNLPSAIDITSCDFMDNSARGIYMRGVMDVSIHSSRFAANDVAAIEMTATAGAVTKALVRNNTIGPTAGYAGNGTGIIVNAGTYAGYQLVGNDLRGNTTALTDNGTVATPDLRVVRDNLGHLVSGAIGAIGANLVQSGTTELILAKAMMNANAVQVGTMIRVRAIGTVTTAGSVVMRIRAGANGTTSDTQAWTNSSATGSLNTVIQGEWLMCVKSTGASGTVSVEGYFFNGSTIVNRANGAPTTTTVNTTAPWWVDVTSDSTSGTAAFTWTHALIEVA